MTIESAISSILEANCSKIYESKQLEDILYFIENNLDQIKKIIGRAEISKFLYYTCVEFNKFSVPSPYVSDDKLFDLFSRALNVFERIEREVNYDENLSRFKVDHIIWSIFNENSIPHSQNPKVDIESIEEYHKQLQQIVEPKLEEKKKEFQECKNRLEQLIEGYKYNNLKTIIETIIPVCPVKREIIIKVEYYGFPTQIRLIPLFMQTGQFPMISEGDKNITIPMANSQWQDSVCKVEICINGLLDSSYSSENLSLPPDGNCDNPSPFIHNYLFELIEKISWNIHKNEDKIGRWLINPNDIGIITKYILVNDQQLYFSQISPPNQIFRISPKTDSQPLIIEDNSILEEKEWFDKCLILAQDKLSLGNTNEAIFWLNVGVEALFERRTQLMCEREGYNYEDFTTSKSFWIEAKDLVEKYISKEEANKIKWPEFTKGIASWFSIIKKISKIIGLKVDYKEILKHYSIVKKHRNAMFHGVNHNRIKSDSVNKAISSFCWIKENYMIK